MNSGTGASDLMLLVELVSFSIAPGSARIEPPFLCRHSDVKIVEGLVS
jgi:hypothetical protein